MRFPKARNREILEQDLDKELLVYDLSNNTAYSLNETSKIIYRACNGKTSFDEIKHKYKFTDDLIHFALDELNEKNLLNDYQSENSLSTHTRREIIKKIGLTSMVAIPLITSIVAPTAISAQSSNRPLQASCTSNSQCQSNFCTTGSGICCVPGTQAFPFTSGGSFCGSCDPTLCCSGSITNNGPGGCSGAGNSCVCN